jgi:MFS family permease
VKDPAVERSLDASVKDGAAYAVMVGLGETYVTACAVFLGASDSAVAMLSTVPLVGGALMQLLTPPVIDRARRRKPAMIGGSVLQALSWAPMILSLVVPRPAGLILLFAGFTLYFATVHFTIPAWLSIMGDLVPGDIRGRYFARRLAFAITMQLLASAAGGIGLSIYKVAGREALGFAVVFAGAMLARFLSVWWLTRMWDPPYAPRREEAYPPLRFLRDLPTSNFARFVLFVACLNASAHFSGALFVPYFLKTLEFSYWEYTAAMTAIVLVQIPALPFWGRIADRYGNKKVLAVTSLGILVLPLLWLVSGHVAWACVAQAAAGLCWAGFNLCASNFLLDAVPVERRASCTAYLNVLVHLGLLAGGIGGAVAAGLRPDHIGQWRLPHWFWGLLIMSFLLRLATIVIFLPRFREVRDVPKVGAVEMLFHATRELSEAALNLFARPGADEKRASR